MPEACLQELGLTEAAEPGFTVRLVDAGKAPGQEKATEKQDEQQVLPLVSYTYTTTLHIYQLV